MKIKLIFMLALAFSLSAEAYVGSETHGGGAFVCRGADGSISSRPLSVELLDLWEARILFGLKIKRDDVRSGESQAWDAFDKLKQWDPDLYLRATMFFGDLVGSQKEKPPGTIIPPPDDIRAPLLRKDCPLEGVAGANDLSGIVYVDSTIINHMGPTEKAALWVHESVYKALRVFYNARSSIDARRITGFLFSDAPVPNYFVDVLSPHISCEDKDKKFVFKLFQTTRVTSTVGGDKWFHLYFSRAGGWPLMAVGKGLASGITPYLKDLYDHRVSQINIVDGPEAVGDLHPLDVSSPYERFYLSFSSSSVGTTLYCH